MLSSAFDFDGPLGVAAALNGDVYVVDTGNCRISKLTASGAYPGQFGGPCGDPNAVPRTPFGVAISRNGTVYVADTGQALIHQFEPA